MKISFIDFWDGFQPENNFIFYLFREAFTEVIVVSPEKADIIIFSVFGNENSRYNHCKRIFFTGENRRPDFSKCDYSISFDFEDYGGKNIRIPLWYYYIDWFGVGTYGNPNYLIPEDYLYEPNEFSKKEKKGFCSAVYSNPVGLRNQFVNLLNSYKRVDCYGKIHGFYNLPDGERYKMEVISNYKFNICFENTFYPGYFTEKLLHAKIAGCIPIYFTEEGTNIDFNPKCFINLKSYGNYQELIEKLILIDSDEKAYSEIKNQPLFDNRIEISEKLQKLKKMLLK